jgi:N-acetylglucosamine-6-phosphate deacetylase
MFDLQVNGYGGVDLNGDATSVDEVSAMCERMGKDGVEAFLGTIISDELLVMEARLRRLVEARERDPVVARMMAGIHVEGPFLNPGEGYRGAHPLAALGPASLVAMKRLLEAGGGLVRLVTLAPEMDEGGRVTRDLVDGGVVVAAGHCDPSFEQLAAAADAGLSMFTHVGNGCPGQLPRHDNVVQRALAMADRLWLCFIPDGVHVPFFALKNYLAACGLERAIFVSDAMAGAGMGPGRHRLGRWEVEVGEDGAARAPGGAHLVGSTLTRDRMWELVPGALGLNEEELRLVSEVNPRRALG